MDDTKPAVASTSVWGGVIALAGALAPTFLGAAGVKNPTDQQAVLNTIFQLVTSIGAATALYGRIKATKRIR